MEFVKASDTVNKLARSESLIKTLAAVLPEFQNTEGGRHRGAVLPNETIFLFTGKQARVWQSGNKYAEEESFDTDAFINKIPNGINFANEKFVFGNCIRTIIDTDYYRHGSEHMYIQYSTCSPCNAWNFSNFLAPLIIRTTFKNSYYATIPDSERVFIVDKPAVASTLPKRNLEEYRFDSVLSDNQELVVLMNDVVNPFAKYLDK